MASRLQLQSELEELLGSENVYYQPPENLVMKYPCIRYNLNSGSTRFADNRPFTFDKEYTITLISYTSNEEMVKKIAMHFPKSRYDRQYKADHLVHDVYTIFY